MSDVEEPGLEYLPAVIEQHEMDRLQREYDAGMYPPGIATTQEIRDDGYARDVDPGVAPARQEAIADWARMLTVTVVDDETGTLPATMPTCRSAS